MTKNSIILIDYENLYKGANRHDLKLTDVGFESLVEHYIEKYNGKDELVLVSCCYANFDGALSLVQSLDYKPIDAIEKGDNMADGYLIAYGVKEIIEKRNEIDTLVLIGGDGIYSSLLRVAASFVNKIVVVSWKDSLSDKLETVKKKITDVEVIEESFDLEERKADGWFEYYAITAVEEEIIRFLLRSERANGFQLVPLANVILNWTTPSVQSQFNQDYNAIFKYLNDCASNDGFLQKHRAPAEKGNREVWWVKLKRNHPKVKLINK